MYSPLLHLIHIPKSAGNSIWRDLIASTEKHSINPSHVIKLDTRNFVDDKYWKNLYFQKSQEYNNNTSFIMTYSYGRALQQSALKEWSKNIKDKNNTQSIFNHRVKMCSLAAKGKWSKDLEN